MALRSPPRNDEWFRARITVKPSGCWIWRYIDARGYGHTRIGGHLVKMHRWAYQRFIGPIPSNQSVLHHCDVPSCVNPDHLFLGIQQDNINDMIEKERNAYGERNGVAKLTEEKILSIRASVATERDLAREYGVNRSTIGSVRRMETWQHIK